MEPKEKRTVAVPIDEAMHAPASANLKDFTFEEMEAIYDSKLRAMNGAENASQPEAKDDSME